MTNKTATIIGIIVGKIAALVACAFILSWLWESVMVVKFDAPVLGFWPMAAVVLVVHTLFAPVTKTPLK